MKKIFIAVALAVSMLFAMSMNALAADFTDVKANDWYTENLSEAVNAGIIKGYEDGTFRPDEKVSRAEMVAMFNRALDIKYSRSISYSDVVASEWYTEDVKKAEYAGIVTGYEDGTFRPKNSISREEAGALMGRIITKGDYEGYNELQSFTDYDAIGSWALDDLGLAFRKEYINGYPDGSFGPGKNLTRAEAITIVMRILNGEKVVKGDVKFTSTGDALRGSIYTGSVTISSPTEKGSFEINDCKVFAPVTFTDDYSYNNINLFTTTVCELVQKSDYLTINMLGKSTIKELTIKNDTTVVSSGEGNLVEEANVEYGTAATNSINSDIEDLVNFGLSVNTKELNINGPTNFTHSGQTITTMNVNAVTDMLLKDGEITTLNMNAKAEDSNIEKSEGSIVKTLNSKSSYFIYALPENAPLMHNVYETTVYVSHMPNEANYSYKNPPTSKLVIKNTLNAPTGLNFTGSQAAFSSDDPVYLNWTAPAKLPKQKIISYNIYYGESRIGTVDAKTTTFDVTEFVKDAGDHSFTVEAVTGNNYYANSVQSEAAAITRLADSEFSLVTSEGETYIYIAANSNVKSLKVSYVEYGRITGDKAGTLEEVPESDISLVPGSANEYLCALPELSAATPYRFYVQAVGSGLSASQLDNRSSVIVDQLSQPAYTSFTKAEDGSYDLNWQYTAPDVLLARSYTYSFDGNDPVDVVNKAYKDILGWFDVIDGTGTVEPDLAKASGKVASDQVVGGESYSIAISAIGTEVDLETARTSASSEPLIVTSAPTSNTVRALGSADAPMLYFDVDANTYSLDWMKSEGVESYDVTSNIIKNGTNNTVTIPQPEGAKVSIEINVPEALTANNTTPLTITNNGNGSDTVSAAASNNTMYRAAPLEVDFNEYTGELSWVDKTNVSKMPEGYQSQYVLRILDLDAPEAEYEYHYINGTTSVNLYSDGYLNKDTSYDVQIINIGDPEAAKANHYAYGEFFDESKDIQVKYGIYTATVKAYRGNYVDKSNIETADSKPVKDAIVNLYSSVPLPAPTPVLTGVTDNDGLVSWPVPYGKTLYYDVIYSEAVEGVKERSDFKLAAPTAPIGSPSSCFTIEDEALTENIFIGRNPLVSLDRTNNLKLIKDQNSENWKLEFDAVPDTLDALQDAYTAISGSTWSGATESGGRITINVGGLPNNVTNPAPVTLTINARAYAGGTLSSQWVNSETEVELKRLASVEFTSFTKDEGGNNTYTLEWDSVESAKAYKVKVGTVSEIVTETSYSGIPANAEVSVTALSNESENENENVKSAIYNVGAKRVLEQNDDSAANPYWYAEIYLDSEPVSVTLEQQEALVSGDFELKTDADVLTWTDDKYKEAKGGVATPNKYIVSIDDKSQFVNKAEVEVTNACEVNVITKGTYGQDTPESIANGITLYTDSASYTAKVDKSAPSNITLSSEYVISWSDPALKTLNKNNEADGESLFYSITIDYNGGEFESGPIEADGSIDTLTYTIPAEVAREILAVDNTPTVIIEAGTVEKSLILGSTVKEAKAAKGFAAHTLKIQGKNNSDDEYHGLAIDDGAITVTTAGGTEVYSFKDVSVGGKRIILQNDITYTVTVDAFTANGIKYQATADTFVVDGYTGDLVVRTVPDDFLVLDTSLSGSYDAAAKQLAVEKVTTYNKGTALSEEQLAAVNYTLYGYANSNSQPVEVATAALEDTDYAIYNLSETALTEYAYFKSVAALETEDKNSIASETTITIRPLDAVGDITIARSAENGTITASWNPVVNATGYTVFNTAGGQIGTKLPATTTSMEIGSASAITVTALGNADGTTVESPFGALAFYTNTFNTKDDIAVTATVKVSAIDSVSHKAIKGTLRVVSTNGFNGNRLEEIYKDTDLPAGGMYIFLPDGYYRAAFKASADYNGLYDKHNSNGDVLYYIIPFTVENGVVSSTPADIVFEAVPVVQQVPMEIGVSLNNELVAGATVTITQTDPKVVDKPFGKFNTVTYNTTAERKSLTMPEGEYEAEVTLSDGATKTQSFTVSADGTKTVDINFFQRSIPVKVINAQTGEPIIKGDVPVVFTDASGNEKEVEVTDDNSKVLLYDGTYDVTVEAGRYAKVDYKDYKLEGRVVSETAPASITIALIPEGAVVLDTATKASIAKIAEGIHAGDYEISFSEITTFNGSQDFNGNYPTASIKTKLCGLDADGEKVELANGPAGTKNKVNYYYVDEATYKEYIANGFVQVATIVDEENTVPNPAGSEAVIKQTQLATPVFNELSWNEAEKQYTLSWNTVDNAVSYTYTVNGLNEKTIEETSLIVEGGQAIAVKANPADDNLYTDEGKILTSDTGEFNYYTASAEATKDVEVSAYVPILVKDGYTGQTVAANVTIDEADEPTAIEQGGTALLLEVGKSYTVTVNKADVPELSNIAYVKDEVTAEFTVAQYNQPVFLTFTPAEAQQLPKPTSLRFNYESDPNYVRVAFSKITIEGDSTAQISYSLVGVKPNGLEEVVNAKPGGDTSVIFHNINSADPTYVSYKVVASATGGTANYIASEVPFTFSNLAAPVFGQLYRAEDKSLMLPWSPVDNATGYSFKENAEEPTKLEANVTSQAVTAGNTYTVKALGNKATDVSTNGKVAFYLDSPEATKPAEEVTDTTEVTINAVDIFDKSVDTGTVEVKDTSTSEPVTVNADKTYSLEDGTYTATLDNAQVPIAISVLYTGEALKFKATPATITFTVQDGVIDSTAITEGVEVVQDGNAITFKLDYNLDVSKALVRILNNGVAQDGYIKLEYADTNNSSGVDNNPLGISKDGTIFYMLQGKNYKFTVVDETGTDLNYKPKTVEIEEKQAEVNVDIDISTTTLLINAKDGNTGREVLAYPLVTAASHENGTEYSPDELQALNTSIVEAYEAYEANTSKTGYYDFKPGTYSFSITSTKLSQGVDYKPLVFNDVEFTPGTTHPPISVIFIPKGRAELDPSAWVKYNGEDTLTFDKVENAVKYQLIGHKKNSPDKYDATKDSTDFKIGDINQYSYFEFFARSGEGGNFIESVTVVTYEQLATPDVQDPYFNTNGQPIISWGAVANAFGYTVNEEPLENTQTYYAVENGEKYEVIATGNVAPNTEIPLIVETNRIALYGDSTPASKEINVTVPVTVNIVDGATGESLTDVPEEAVTAALKPEGEPENIGSGAKLLWGAEYNISLNYEAIADQLTANKYENVEPFNYTAKFSNREITINMIPADYIELGQSPRAFAAINYTEPTTGEEQNTDKLKGDGYSGEIKFTPVEVNSDDPTLEMTYELSYMDELGKYRTIGTLGTVTSNEVSFTLSGSDILNMYAVTIFGSRLYGERYPVYLELKATATGSHNYTVSKTKLTLNLLENPKKIGIEKADNGMATISWSSSSTVGLSPLYIVKDSQGNPEATTKDLSAKVPQGGIYTVTAVSKSYEVLKDGTTAGVNIGNGINIYLPSDTFKELGTIGGCESFAPTPIVVPAFNAELKVVAFDGANGMNQIPADSLDIKVEPQGEIDGETISLSDGEYTVNITYTGVPTGVYVDNGVVTRDIKVENGSVDPIYVTFMPMGENTLPFSASGLMYKDQGLAVLAVKGAENPEDYTLYGYTANKNEAGYITGYEEKELGVAGGIFSNNSAVVFQRNPFSGKPDDPANNYFSSYKKVKDYDYLTVKIKSSDSANNYSAVNVIEYKTLATPQLNAATYGDDGKLVLTWSPVPNAIKYAVYVDGSETPVEVEGTSYTVENGKSYKVQAIGNFTKGDDDINVKADVTTGAITFYADSEQATTGEIDVKSSVVFSANVEGNVSVSGSGTPSGTNVQLVYDKASKDYSASYELPDGKYTATFTADTKTDVALDLGGRTAKYTAANAEFTVQNGVLQGKVSVDFDAAYVPQFTTVDISLAGVSDEGFGLVISTNELNDETSYSENVQTNDVKVVLGTKEGTGNGDNGDNGEGTPAKNATLEANVLTGETYYIYALQVDGKVIPSSEIVKTYEDGTTNDTVKVTIVSDGKESAVDEAITVVDGKVFNDINDAVDAALDSKSTEPVITLQSNSTLTDSIVVNAEDPKQNVTLDLNSKNLNVEPTQEGDATPALMVTSGNLKITNTSNSKDPVTISSANGAGAWLGDDPTKAEVVTFNLSSTSVESVEGPTLTIGENVKVSGTTGVHVEKGNLNVEAATITGTTGPGININATAAVAVNINETEEKLAVISSQGESAIHEVENAALNESTKIALNYCSLVSPEGKDPMVLASDKAQIGPGVTGIEAGFKGRYYKGIASAVTAVNANQSQSTSADSPDKITVYNDATVTAPEPKNKSASLVFETKSTAYTELNLNGKTLDDGDAPGREVIEVKSGNLKITGGEGSKIISKQRGISIRGLEDNDDSRGGATPIAEVTIDAGVTVESTGDYGVGALTDDGTFELDTSKKNGSCAIFIAGPLNGNNTAVKAKLNIYGKVINNCVVAAISGNGDYDGTEINVYKGAKIVAENSIGIYHPQYGTLNVYGGIITGNGKVEAEGGAGIAIKAGTLNVYGGTIQSDGTYLAPAQIYQKLLNTDAGGVNGEGSAIFIASESAYKTTVQAGIKVNIGGEVTNGVNVDEINITSTNGHAIREVLFLKKTDDNLGGDTVFNENVVNRLCDNIYDKGINITSGTLTSAANLDTYVFYGLPSEKLSPEMSGNSTGCNDLMKTRNASKITVDPAVTLNSGSALWTDGPAKYFTVAP